MLDSKTSAYLVLAAALIVLAAAIANYGAFVQSYSTLLVDVIKISTIAGVLVFSAGVTLSVLTD